MDIHERLQKGIQAVKAGDLQTASGILAQIVSDNPGSEDAWLWLGKSRTVKQQRDYCFQRVLQINPGNIEAKTLLGEPDQVENPQVVLNAGAEIPIASAARVSEEKPISDNKPKILALAGGLVLAFLLCGAPLLYMVNSGRFQQLTKPFVGAVFTAVEPTVTFMHPTATLSPIPTVTEVPVSSLSYSQRFDIADPYISEALGYFFQGSHADAILAWDKALEIVPDYAEGHYIRGESYFALLQNQRSQEEFMLYLSRAGEDFDKAVELAPYSKGDYYYGRFKYYDALSSNQVTRVDSDHFEQIALDNLLMANQLGNYKEDAEVKLALVYIAVGKCDEGIEQANRLIAEADEPSIDMVGSLAIGYFCKNDLPNALKHMNQVVELVDNCRSRLDRARILYAMDRTDDALSELDYTISKDPYYCGMRYYLRGLIYAENGEFEKAQDDLNFGMGQTWERGGLLSYAQGKIALAQDDKEAAILYFQDAEFTYKIHDPILTKIRDDLTVLDASPLEIVSSFPHATAISTPTAPLTPRPISSPISSIPTPAFTPDPILQYASIVDIEKTIGPIKIGWNSDGLWRFQPAQALDHREVQKLSVWVISSDTSQRLPRQLFVWNFRNNMWGGVEELNWGENRLEFPNEYVSLDGDVIIHLMNHDNTLESTVDTLGITLVIQRTDGSIEVHGITP